MDKPASFSPHLRILGTRGVPAQHGGFETFAEHLALYLVERGWDITVYCQVDGAEGITEDTWRGVRRVNIGVKQAGALGTVVFDARCVRHARREPGVLLTLGYNTAVFSLGYLGRRLPHAMNMDGIEWRRAKWSGAQRAWLYINERLGCLLAHRLVADHPEIGKHLETRVSPQKITVIPYGSDALYDGASPPPADVAFPATPGRYAMVIARPDPENSILEVVTAFSRRPRAYGLVVLGTYDPQNNPYHRAVQAAASDEVVFPGAIYDKAAVGALRWHCALYIHGHTVGGTNPSLVEALGAGNPVLAHDNPFNRWVAGPEAAYFGDMDGCDAALTRLLSAPDALANMAAASRVRHAQALTWPRILGQYEDLLEDMAGCVTQV
jgi:glycosyltransferase involved in cell wall biosynthesis